MENVQFFLTVVQFGKITATKIRIQKYQVTLHGCSLPEMLITRDINRFKHVWSFFITCKVTVLFKSTAANLYSHWKNSSYPHLSFTNPLYSSVIKKIGQFLCCCSQVENACIFHLMCSMTIIWQALPQNIIYTADSVDCCQRGLVKDKNLSACPCQSFKLCKNVIISSWKRVGSNFASPELLQWILYQGIKKPSKRLIK